MIKALTVFTYEVDDPALALREIKTQIAQNLTLLRNTAGILMCDPEFIESGVYSAICSGLGFPLAGATTMSQAVNGETGVMMLTIMILTSDDVFFSTGHSAPIRCDEDVQAALAPAYARATAELPDAPKLIFAFPPLLADNAGDSYVEAFEALCPGTPVFGTLAVDDTLTYENSRTLCNGENFADNAAFILVCGNIRPRFLAATPGYRSALPYAGEITKSQGHIVEEINDILCAEYFERIGYAKNGVLDAGVQFVPFVLDCKKREDYDGVPIVRAMIFFDAKGRGVCRGHMFQGSVFTLTNPTRDDIFESSTELLAKIAALSDIQAVVLFSCMVRRMAFGAFPLTEAEMPAAHLPAATPFLLAYSGGEICPTTYSQNKLTNRFHNYSLVACIL